MHNGSEESQSNLKNIVTAYLLGRLGQDEQERIEERFLVDQDFFEEAQILEDEIIDDYLSGTLSDREGFIRCFLSTPRRRQKVRNAMALAMYISDSEHDASAKSAAETDSPFWSRIFRWALRQQHSASVTTSGG
jgi:hypothetical protein